VKQGDTINTTIFEEISRALFSHQKPENHEYEPKYTEAFEESEIVSERTGRDLRGRVSERETGCSDKNLQAKLATTEEDVATILKELENPEGKNK
jgi:hypothetical protein